MPPAESWRPDPNMPEILTYTLGLHVVTDFNTDHNCGKNTYSDKVFDTSPGLDITGAPVAPWSLDTNTVPDDSPGNQHISQWQQEPWISTQTLSALGSQMQAWHPALALAWMPARHQVVACATHICMTLIASWPLGTNMVTGG